jgi:putative salt-induced outer membrane protein
MRTPLALFALLLAPPLGGLARADEVLLVSGERLVGKVVSFADGKMTFESAGIGSVTLDLAKVKTFATEGAVEIHFKDGTVVNQPVQGAEEGKFSIGPTGVLGPQTLPLSEIATINPPKIETKWTGSATLGVTFVRGNTETDAASFDLEAVRRSEIDRLTFRGNYRSARAVDDTTGDLETTERSLGGSLKYDYFLSKRAYLLASARAEKDAIAELDLRFLASAGAGYQWVESDPLKFSTEGGVGWISESFSDTTPSTDQVALRVAYRLEKAFGPSVKFIHLTEGVHGFDDPHDYLVSTEGALRANLTKAMYSEGKIVLNWDSTPADQAERTDVRYILGFGWAF